MPPVPRGLAGRLLSFVVLIVLLGGCATLPAGFSRTDSSAFRATDDTELGRRLGPLVAQHPGRTGLHPLARGLDAFAARLVLAEAAERSLDVQYYIWHGDTTGQLLLGSVLRAADRGVRVRLLLDDIGTAADDEVLLAIDAHPNVEVRLFNPVAMRSARGLGFLIDFGRVNRRMHNKSFTADNQVTIVGGRNVGDEYYEARPDLDFGDLDVMAVGAVVPEVSAAFDLYWNSAAALPIAVLAGERPQSPDLAQVRARLEAHVEATRTSVYADALRQSGLAEQLRRGELAFFWGQAWLAYDDPGKVAGDSGDHSTHLGPKVRQVFDAAKSELLVISPYFVPGEEGVAFFRALRDRGVRIRILTNSLASTDVAAVHAGYARYRERLLQAGVELYEVRPTARIRPEEKGEGQSSVLGGSSRASLHAKTFIVDRHAVFVGSLNLDPRSVVLNTEIGILFDNQTAAALAVEGFERATGQNAFRLELVDDGVGDGAAGRQRLEWVIVEDGRERRFTTEPDSSLWRRFGVWLLSLLPIEDQL